MKASFILILVAALFCLAMDGYAQGRGGGRSSRASGPPSGSGVDRGLGNASTRSGGRSDDRHENASKPSARRSAKDVDRALLARENANRVTDTELNRYRGLSKRLGTTPMEMRARYQAALLQNPRLTYGNFVAAHVISDNYRDRLPQVTSTAILNGLANGDSLGQTLRSLRLSKEQAKYLQRDAQFRIEAAKHRNRSLGL